MNEKTIKLFRGSDDIYADLGAFAVDDDFVVCVPITVFFKMIALESGQSGDWDAVSGFYEAPHDDTWTSYRADRLGDELHIEVDVGPQVCVDRRAVLSLAEGIRIEMPYEVVGGTA